MRTEAPHRGQSAGRVVFGVVALTALLWMVGRSPVAPFPLALAESYVASGQVEDAVAHLDDVATWHPLAEVRLAAQRRAASLSMLELQRPDIARDRLQRLLDAPGRPAEVRASLWSELGHVLQQGVGDPTGAADAFVEAYNADRTAEGAAEHLIAAARAYEAATLPDRAYQVWERLARRHREHRAAARLEQAAILLARGKIEAAHDRYEEARTVAPEGSREAEVGQLGVATCLERQGLVEEALVELDGAGLAPEVLEPRREALLEREAD